MSAKIATLLNLNLNKTSHILESIFGPEYKQSLREGPLFPHDASNTARIFVVSLSSLTTGL